MILDAEPDLEVVGEAADGREALRARARARPDVVLMDVRMPVLDGLEATRLLLGRVRQPRGAVLTTFDLDEYVYEAIRAGASGFLLKSAPPRAARRRRSARPTAGDALLAPEVTRRLLDRFVGRPPRPAGTPPELGAEPARARGAAPDRRRPLERRDRRRRCTLSEATVKTHVNHILTKLRLRDRVQAVALAYRTGFADTSST